MGKPVTLLERLCDHTLQIGAESMVVKYQDGSDWVYARKGDDSFNIAKFRSSSHESRELRKDLYAAAGKSIRTVIGGRAMRIKVRVSESFGEDAFSVSIEAEPPRDWSAPKLYTPKQGQYLAFIYYYTKMHRCAPAESDLQAYFRTSAPSVHQMVVTLTANGLIERTPGQARSIRLLIPMEALPKLE